MFRKIENMIIYQDDICVGASSKELLKQKTKRVLKELKKARLSINPDKCEFNCETINFLSFKISKEGISPDQNLQKKIEQISTSTNKKGVGKFSWTSKFLQ